MSRVSVASGCRPPHRQPPATTRAMCRVPPSSTTPALVNTLRRACSTDTSPSIREHRWSTFHTRNPPGSTVSPSAPVPRIQDDPAPPTSRSARRNLSITSRSVQEGSSGLCPSRGWRPARHTSQKLAGDATSHAERLFKFLPWGLSAGDAQEPEADTGRTHHSGSTGPASCSGVDGD